MTDLMHAVNHAVVSKSVTKLGLRDFELESEFELELTKMGIKQSLMLRFLP